MIVKDKFKRKDGQLTAYSFACGYVQEFGDEKGNDSKFSVQLYMEHSHYHVRSFDYVARNDGAAMDWNAEGGWRTWVTFDANELSLARKAFADLKRKFKSKA